MFWRLSIPTDDGEFIAYFSERGLARLDFPADPERRPPPSVTREPGTDEQRTWGGTTVSALKEALRGRPPKVLPPFDWTGCPVFQQDVWRAMLRIPIGATRTYGQIATEIGQPTATRPTGTACGANPIPVLVPCHRVVAANGRLGGFSGGLDWKRRLLGRESVTLELDSNPDGRTGAGNIERPS